MNVGITGHTSGIGKAIADALERRGHRCVGFSRANGHDVADSAARARIVAAAEGLDAFVNNAHAGFAQAELLFALQASWRGKKRVIANVGSSITMRWDTGNRDPMYRNHKLALDEACEFLWNRDPWPHILLFKPCATDTARMAHWKGPKAAVAEIAELLVDCMLRPGLRVQQVGVAALPPE